MLCERCNQREAEVQIKQIMDDGTEVDNNLCRMCAVEVGGPAMPQIVIGMALKDVLFALGQMMDDGEPEVPEISCQECGIKWEECLSDGLLGCAGCYTAFRHLLAPAVLKVHGLEMAHTPIELFTEDGLPVWDELDDLHLRLGAAVEREEYEHAATIRDRIRSIEDNGSD